MKALHRRIDRLLAQRAPQLEAGITRYFFTLWRLTAEQAAESRAYLDNPNGKPSAIACRLLNSLGLPENTGADSPRLGDLADDMRL